MTPNLDRQFEENKQPICDLTYSVPRMSQVARNLTDGHLESHCMQFSLPVESLSQIACKMGHSVESLSQIACKMGHPMESLSQIACKMGHSVERLSHIARKMGRPVEKLSQIACKMG